jgi:hypothetical protein
MSAIVKIIAESSGSKNWWNLDKRLLGSSKNRSIPPLQTDDDLICDNFTKCELINDFFSEQSNLDDSGGFKMEAPSLISRGFIKSGPVAFVVSSNCRTSSISVYSKIVLLPHTNQGSLLVTLQLTNF